MTHMNTKITEDFPLEVMARLIEKFGQRYSEVLGIDLRGGEEKEIFKWFLASVLFGAPINETSVVRTYRCFQKHKLLTPDSILERGWEDLVGVLDEGGYTRYDFKTADKLLEVMGNLIANYAGSIILLHEQSSSSFDLENRVKDLGKGIGDVTVGIFLRELRELWEKAEPKPTPLVIFAATNLGMVGEGSPEKAFGQLKVFWRKNEIAGKTFTDFETALLRLGKDFCRRKKCRECVVRGWCSVVKPT